MIKQIVSNDFFKKMKFHNINNLIIEIDGETDIKKKYIKIVCLYKDINKKLYLMLAGGKLAPINKLQFNIIWLALDKILRK